MMIRSLLTAAALLAAMPANADVTLRQVKQAKTAEQFLALGGRVMTAREFQDRVVGRELDEGTWLWFVNRDGSHSARAKDGSWSDSGGQWELRGNEYCRNTAKKPAMNCSAVFVIGDYMRMGQQDGALAKWTVEIK